jgi:hypothetical protein
VLAHEPRGFVVKTESGRIRDGVYALGEITGTALAARAIAAEADALASTLTSI